MLINVINGRLMRLHGIGPRLTPQNRPCPQQEGAWGRHRALGSAALQQPSPGAQEGSLPPPPQGH